MDVEQLHRANLEASLESPTPRLPTSKSSTPLPSDFVGKVKTIFGQQFKNRAAHGEFLVEGRIYPDEVVMRIGYLESGRLKQMNFEASMDVPLVQEIEVESEEGAGESLTMARLYTCIDALGSLVEEYFEKEDVEEMEISHVWKPYQFENETVFLQYSTVNSRLEAAADRLLGILDDEENLVRENGSSSRFI